MTHDPVNEGALRDAVAHLRTGGLVAFPTETVYGLGADAMNADAVQRIFDLKGRPESRPLTAHVTDAVMARAMSREWPARADELAERFWPGPLTIIVPRAPDVPDGVVAGGDTVGVRCPDHPIALALIRAFGGPIVAPSANRFGAPPSTTAAHVAEAFPHADGLLILDGGECPRGIESTVLAIGYAGESDRILRPGPIGPEDLGGTVELVQFSQPSRTHSPLRAPVRSCVASGMESLLSGSTECAAVIAHTDEVVRAVHAPHRLFTLPNRASTYAARLYATLREAESVSPVCIVIERPTGEGQLWDAVRDRIDRLAR